MVNSLRFCQWVEQGFEVVAWEAGSAVPVAFSVGMVVLVGHVGSVMAVVVVDWKVAVVTAELVDACGCPCTGGVADWMEAVEVVVLAGVDWVV